MSLVEKLKAVRALIERGWCQLFMALDSEHNLIDANHSKACYWCISGAARAVGLNPTVLASFLGFDSNYSMVEFNDNPETTKQEVIDRLSNAIAKLEMKRRFNEYQS